MAEQANSKFCKFSSLVVLFILFMSKLWGGRFSGKTDPLMERFNASLPFDKRLYSVDIRGSQAYARGLHACQLITTAERDKLIDGLQRVHDEWESNQFHIDAQVDEDIHTANERRLGELIGTDISGKLHTGRSRNDQVATDMRLWMRQECEQQLRPALMECIGVLVDRAHREMDVLMPGYTHLQRAQPIRWSHFLLSYAWQFHADLVRLNSLLLESQSRSGLMASPLGSGALAGNPFGLDRASVASDLGFSHITPNSLLGVGDRDMVADFLYAASMTMLHLSRLAEDIIIYSSAEFGFIQLADAYSTGSSLMPQKKNPDSLELLRGKCGRVFGDLTGFLMTYKGLPSTYNKDLQEDKEPMFDAMDTVTGSLRITSGVMATLSIRKDRMHAALTPDMLATDVAEYLVRKGMPFRQAHHKAGEVVALAEQKGCLMSELSLTELKGICDLFDKDIADPKWWDFERSVESRNVVGGTSRSSIERQIQELRVLLQKQQ